jgi:intracellular sulfur oxidation DsrE/DsrF family protein
MQIRKNLVLPLLASTLAMAAAPAVFAAPPAAEPMASGYVKPNMKHDSYGDLKIVVPITTDDKAIQGMKLRNLSNSLMATKDWKGEIEATVVLYAKGLSLLKNPDDGMRTMVDELTKKGVRFEVCNNSLKEQSLDFHSLYHVADKDIVPSGFAEVAYLQAKKHYVVDPAN